MIFYSVILQLIPLYSGITRRDREDYIQHVLRTAQLASRLQASENVQLLCLLHDVLEVNPKVTMLQLRYAFCLSNAQERTLSILTALKGETSEQHFYRVLTSGDIDALFVKFCDTHDNSIFIVNSYFDDYEFTRKVVGKDPQKEQAKYKKRKLLLKDKLLEFGVIIKDV